MVELITSLGISGALDTSGIKASVLRCNGDMIVEKHGSLFLPYSSDLKRRILSAKAELSRLYGYRSIRPDSKSKLLRRVNTVSKKKDEIQNLSNDITKWTLQVIKNFVQNQEPKIDVIGFNGQPILFKAKHADFQALSYSLGNPLYISDESKIPLVYDFVETDAENGGNGFPLHPMYYKALIKYSSKYNFISDKQKIALVDISEMTNITIFDFEKTPISFDSGPGNVLVNEYVQRNFQKSDDNNGLLAVKGEIYESLISKWIKKDIFSSNKQFFKAMDFFDFLDECSRELTPIDCITTLTAFTAKTIIESLDKHEGINTVIIVGSGSKNEFIKTILSRYYSIFDSRKLFWDDKFFESELYAFLAASSIFATNTSFPGTTGVLKPMPCGKITFPSNHKLSISKVA